MARFLPVLALAIAMLSSVAAANSISLNASLYGYLSTYIPNSTLNSASFFNMTLNHKSYVIMQLSSGTNRFVVINTTKRYSAMLNAANISAVLGPFLLVRYYPNQSTLNYLNASMHSYVKQSSGPIADCLNETGLGQFTCTQANSCYACQSVPICKNYMSYLGGPGNSNSAPFIDGMMNFSSQYAELNTNYSSYFSALSRFNASNTGASISAISGSMSAINSIVAELSQNPIFQLPNSYNLATLPGTCAGYSSTNQPWFCLDMDFCQTLNFNSVLMSGIQSKLAQLQASPLSSAGLGSVSRNSSSIASGYVMAVVSGEENQSFSAFLNATEPGYNSVVQKSEALLGMFGNSVLSASLQSLEGTFTAILNSGASQNLTAANAMLANALSKTESAYSAAYAAFLPVYTTAQSNNYLLAVDQLSYSRVPAGLARLALEQQKLNAEIGAGINRSQLSPLLSELKSVSAGLGAFMPFTLGSMVKALDGGIAGMLLVGTATLSAKNFGAALYAAIISLIIGCLLVLVFHMSVYHRLKHKHKIKFHKRARKAWRALFVLLGICVIIYAIATYAAAGSANALLPVSGFTGAVAASKSVAIALNSTGPDMQACAASVGALLSGMGKSVYVISMVNGSCASPSAGFSGPCIGKVAGNMPVVFISNGNSSIVYRGMYGHVLYADGAAASGASCPLDELFSK